MYFRNGRGSMMREIVHFAQKTMKTLTKTLPFRISFTDEKGIILSDSDPNRIGTSHPPSIKVLEIDDMILFEPSVVKEMENVLPGVAVPLKFDGQSIGVLGIVGDPTEVQPFAKLVKQYVEMMWQESKKLQADELRRMKMESFLHYILMDSKHQDEEQVKVYADLLNIDMSYQRVCILIDIGQSVLTEVNDEPQVVTKFMFKDKLLNCVTTAFGKENDNICSFLSSEKMIFLRSIKDDKAFRDFIESFKERATQLLEMLRVYNITKVKISAGGIADSLLDVSGSYHEAEKLIKHGHNMEESPQILTYYDWNVLLKILPSQIKSDFKHYVRERLYYFFQDEDRVELSHNFSVYCRCNMNISQAAKQLYIHRNTLMYRLKKIEKLTGLDMNNFEHCMILYFSLNQ